MSNRYLKIFESDGKKNESENQLQQRRMLYRDALIRMLPPVTYLKDGVRYVSTEKTKSFIEEMKSIFK